MVASEAESPTGAATSRQPARVWVVAPERIVQEALVAAIDADPRFASEPSESAEPAADVALVVLGSRSGPARDAIAEAARAGRQARVVLIVHGLDDSLHDALIGHGADAVVSSSETLATLLAAVAGESSNQDRVGDASHEEAALEIAQGFGLTARQYEVLQLLANGLSADHVARRLDIATATARDHIKALRRTFDCTSTTQVVVAAAQRGMLPSLYRPVL